MRDVLGYEGYYKIDEQGNVLSIRTGKTLKPSEGRYKTITFSVNGEKKTYRVHRLVYESYKGEIPEGKVINHKDGNTYNNSLSNLECVTQKENIDHAYETGLNYKCPFGLDSFNFKGEVLVYKNGEYLLSLFGHSDIVNKGFTSCGVSAVLSGLQKTHRGCTFKRKEKEDV